MFVYIPFLFHYGWEYRQIKNPDLPSFYTASRLTFVNGEMPYDPARLQQSMGGKTLVYPYLYPPPSLFFFFPLSKMTYHEARLILLLVNHALILLLLWLIPFSLLRLDSERKGILLIVCIVYILMFHPIAVTLNHGQINLFVLTSLILFWLLARREMPLWAGFFLAVAVLLKTYPLILLPLLFLIGRKKEAVYSVAWLGLAAIASFLFLPGGIWQEWLTKIMPMGGYAQIPAGLFSPAADANQSLNGFFARAFMDSRWSHPIMVNPGLAKYFSYSFSGLIILSTFFVTFQSAKRHRGDVDRVMLLVLPTMFLVAPFSWEHHLVTLIPSILLLLTRPRSPHSADKVFFILLSGAALLLGLPFLRQIKFFGVAVIWGLSLMVVKGDEIILGNYSDSTART